jgi:hypothetical protein
MKQIDVAEGLFGACLAAVSLAVEAVGMSLKRVALSMALPPGPPFAPACYLTYRSAIF